jgi:hypothetical protein
VLALKTDLRKGVGPQIMSCTKTPNPHHHTERCVYVRNVSSDRGATTKCFWTLGASEPRPLGKIDSDEPPMRISSRQGVGRQSVKARFIGIIGSYVMSTLALLGGAHQARM